MIGKCWLSALLSFVFVVHAHYGAAQAQEFLLPKDISMYSDIEGLNNVDLGKGYSSLSLKFGESLRHKCVSGPHASLNSLSGGKTIGYLKTVSTQTELYDSLDKGFSIDGKTTVVNFNGVSDLLKIMSYNYKHSYAFVFIKKEMLPQNITDPKINVDISQYSDAREFISHCGDNYISTFVAGSYAFGAIDCWTTTQDSQIKATNELSKISGSIQNGKLSGTGGLKSTKEQIEKMTGTECHLWSQFDGGSGLVSSDPDKFIDSLWNYAQSDKDRSPTILSIGFDNYVNAASPGKELSFVNKIYPLILPAAGEISRYRKRIAFRADEIEGLENLMAVSSGSDFEGLAGRKAELESEIADLEKWAEACARDPYRSWGSGRCGMQ